MTTDRKEELVSDAERVANILDQAELEVRQFLRQHGLPDQIEERLYYAGSRAVRSFPSRLYFITYDHDSCGRLRNKVELPVAVLTSDDNLLFLIGPKNRVNVSQ